MKNYGHGPSPMEVAFDVVGPTVRGSLSAADGQKYCSALFSEPIQQTATSRTVVDMAKFADGNTHVTWLAGGVFVRIKPSAACHVNMRFDTGTATAYTTSSLGHPLDANEEIELRFDEDYRYLEYVFDVPVAGQTLMHWKRQRPNQSLTTSDV